MRTEGDGWSAGGYVQIVPRHTVSLAPRMAVAYTSFSSGTARNAGYLLLEPGMFLRLSGYFAALEAGASFSGYLPLRATSVSTGGISLSGHLLLGDLLIKGIAFEASLSALMLPGSMEYQYLRLSLGVNIRICELRAVTEL